MSTVPQRLGQYELRQQLGHGNVGEVWKAYDSRLRRDVAIKVIYTDLQSDPNFLTRFTQEGRKVASLHHSNIVQVRDVAINHQSSNTTAYIVSDYIESQTLGEYIAATRHKGIMLSLTDIVYLFTSLGVAIDYAHQKGVVHGNIKPSNILLDKLHVMRFVEGEPILTDFGLALLLGDEAGIGTPQYMAPEQAKGDPANNRSDIYSLGVILYELCTGVQPFRDESSVAVMMQHINTLPTPPILINPQLPPALSEVILRAMAKDTATRFPMASLLATAIADACSIRSTLPIPRVALAEEETANHAGSGQFGSFLGVPQSVPPVAATARPISQPMPRVHPRISSPSQPLPTITQRVSLPSIPAVSGKQRPMQQGAIPVGAPVPNKIPTASTSPAASPIMSAKIAVPQQQGEPSLVSRMPTSSTSTGRLLNNTPFPVAGRNTRSRLTDIPMYAVLAVFAVLLIIAISMIGSLLLNSRVQPGTIVGHVFFQDDALGRADVLHIDMQNISAPPQGKIYQAWLQDINHHTLPLGPLTLNNDTATLLYPGDAQHTNLLSIAQGVLVTLEDTGGKPHTPTGDGVYKASFDTPSFQYIKNILYKTPDFPDNNGVIVGLFETIKSINDKAGSITDSIQGTHDYHLARRQAIRIIELVDGTQYSMASGDLPKNTPSNVHAKVGLISSPTQPGYIDTLATQLDKLQQSAGNNTTLLQHIQNVRNAVADLRQWVQQIRTYDVQVLKARSLTEPALANVALQLKQVVSDSYTGRTIPPDEGPKSILGSAGAYQAYVECQYLMTLDMKKV